MTIRRFSSRTHRLDSSFLLEHLKGARSYKRIAGYFTSSLFEVANELLEAIPEVKIVCNVDIHPGDLKVAQLRESKMIGRWNEQGLEAEALLNEKMLTRATLKTLLVDHSKFGRRLTYRVAALAPEIEIITDDGLEASWRQRLADIGCAPRIVAVPKGASEGLE